MQKRYQLTIIMTQEAYHFLHKKLTYGAINDLSDVFTSYGWGYGYFAFDTEREIEEIKKEIEELLRSNGYKFDYKAN
jgi:hypothetical protein